MHIGFGELIVVLFVAMLVIGPDKMPEMMRKLGRGFRQLQAETRKLTDAVDEEVGEPLQESVKQVNDALYPKKKKASVSKAAAAETWVCPSCGHQASGKFCNNCGTKKPEIRQEEESL
jgi:Tat protein translocase TatB subunit